MNRTDHMDAADIAAMIALGVAWLCIAGLVLALFVGWVLNIVALAGTGTGFTVLVALRILGIFIAPLGAVLGYM